ncbi:ABC transporter permease [Geodermatophilus sabuli]|uniref:Peptide/nickel transport system permease protein n=1 Tax=Geodermatophilus sabuli TaxID=1564158 RepID=A0A285E897_9ACTN|nr:ABC transporter permease [Geodermatophilus sabuli]MBB3082035.1 peptide/nickel transport system permease protein [Geodermatophilus sabuli]SNX95093.1 peptide/nickel transport system permease protein [Geodermatophilus sabuli]
MAVVEPAPSFSLSPEVDEAEARAGGRGRRWRSQLGTWIPAGMIAFVLVACFLGPTLLSLPSPVGGSVLESNQPAFSPGHVLGTDPNGNDILSRLLHGGQSSLWIALAVNLLGLVVGGTLGALSGYVGGWVDTAIMRVLDVLIAFPSLVLTLAVAQALGPSMTNTIFALAFFSIPAFARLARSAVLRLREMPFMAAAQLAGTSPSRMLFKHLAPNIAPQLITFGMLGMGIVIIIEGALSFLGLGIPDPAPSWGNMVATGQLSLSATPMLVVWPSLALLVTVLAFNLLGENLRARWSGR